jgi:hypothetical protein
MLRLRPRRSIPFLLVLLCGTPFAAAQNVMLNAPGLLPPKKDAGPPPPRAQPLVWPRLDAGAILCRTADDLDRHASNMIARVGGGDIQSADCHAIAQPTGVQIVSREGPGKTQVRLNGSGNTTGWTDVWLPDKAPAAR